MNCPITVAALRWLEIIFSERFGKTWSLAYCAEGLRLRLVGAKGSIVFDRTRDGLTEVSSNQLASWWDADQAGWYSALGSPIPAPGDDNLPVPLIETYAGEYFIHYDIPGLTYWMLARVEEINRSDLDNHQRFPAKCSHAAKFGYLDRPVVDEWLNILGQVIQRQWPGLTLKKHEFHMRVSHDVDQPSLYAFKSWNSIVRMMVGHAVKRRDISAFVTAPYVKMATGDHLMAKDPCNTFDWLMDISEASKLQSAFYFICGGHHFNDADYQPDHPIIRDLVRRIHKRGHEIGLHPSYETFQQPQLIKQEADRLRKLFAEEGVSQRKLGGRMHFLRWEQPTTMRALTAAGLDYDSTLGYADQAGFRCGTCYEYPAFDAKAQESLRLRIRPLIAMDQTVIADRYMGLGVGEAAKALLLKLKANCHSVGGCFSLLWHNSSLKGEDQKGLYTAIISGGDRDIAHESITKKTEILRKRN